MSHQQLAKTIEALAIKGKGILAADESTGTIGKRFQTHNIPSTEETRRDYRSLLFTAPGIAEFIAGVILYEETLMQKTKEGTLLPTLLSQQGIVPGIKVDKGLVPLAHTPDEKITQGLDGLAERLATYKEYGARFAKWREVFTITSTTPSLFAIQTNAEIMARYAAICQTNGIVPIVEPEVLMDGDHPIERCAEVTETILHEVFYALHRHHVTLEHIVLKPNMSIAGEKHSRKNSAEEVAEATLTVLGRTVPAAVSTINFLSGGQSSEQATANLQAMNVSAKSRPWLLSYSYGRALQEHCLSAWKGNPENINIAQQALYKRSKLNSLASLGQYNADMEK